MPLFIGGPRGVLNNELSMVDITDIREFLYCPTPNAWLESAVDNQSLLLLDHANCEKKAASTALNLIYRYVDNFTLLNKLSRLAREELRHFEQVIAIMKKRHIAYEQLSASRYAGELHKLVRTHEPARMGDTLIVGAIIEARSCERFAALAPLLDSDLRAFYLSLLKSESRHYLDYLGLAKSVMGNAEVLERQDVFLLREAQLIQDSDQEFRFHSGVMT